MSKTYLIIVALCTVLAMSSCKNGKSHKSHDADEDETEMTGAGEGDEPDNGWDVTDQLERADYTFSTEVIADENNTAEKIIVTMKNNQFNMSFQTEVEPIPLDTTFWSGFGTIREDDINFDGYPDLMVCLGPFNTYGNYSYAAWLWDQDMHDFVPVEGFDELFDPDFNAATKTIASRFRMDDHEDDAVYRWKGQELELVRSDTTVYSEMEDE